MTTVTETATKSKADLLKEAYTRTLYDPLQGKYEDTWEEDTFWTAVEKFKAEAKEIGYDDAFEVLGEYYTSFDQIRDKFKAGPPAHTRPGWKSPIIGTKLDTVAAILPLEHLNGPKYNGDERIVVLDFWATWCPPCVRAGPELSDLSEKYRGRVAIVGVNNESMFSEKGHDVEKVKTFLEGNKEGFRYTVYVDTPEGHARESVYRKSGYRSIPCVVLVVDGEVTFVGPPREAFIVALEEALVLVPAKEE